MAHFIAAFQRGHSLLSGYGPGIMGMVGKVAYGVAALQILASGANLAAIGLGMVLLFLSLAIHLYLLTFLPDIATGLFTWFANLGGQVSGFGAGDFLQPSNVLRMGFTVAKPLLDVVLRLGVVKFLTSFWTVAIFFVAMVVIVITFAYTTRHVIMAILQFHLALMVTPVLFPWAILTHTAFFGEFIVTWLISSCLRVFFVAAVLGIGAGLVEGITPLLTPGGDPTLTSAIFMAIASWLFFVLADQVARQAETVGGRGYALGLAPPGIGQLASTALHAAVGQVGHAIGAAVARAVASLGSGRRGP